MVSVEELVKSHFRKCSRESLVNAFYKEINDENMFEFFSVDNLLVKKAIAKKINRHIRDEEFIDKIIQGLNSDSSVREGILTVLSYANLCENNELLSYVKQNLRYGDEKVKTAAATVTAYQYPDHALDLVPLLGHPMIATIICYSQNPAVIEPLLEFYGFPENKKLSPTLGYLLNPFWLARNYSKEREYLVTEFGYCNCAVDDNVLQFLDQGFWFASEEMASITPDISAWQRRVSELSKNLLPLSLGMSSDDVSVDFEDKIDTALFLAAVRESDVSNLMVKKEKNPFDYRESIGVLTCSHSPYRHFKRWFIDQAIELGKSLGVTDLGSFIVDYARMKLETDAEARVEADMFLRSKWLAMGKGSCYLGNYPILSDEDFPLAKFAVIDKFKLKEYEKLSPGGNSVANIGKYLGFDISDKLLELESAYSFLMPVGIEMQIPKGDKNTSLAWKQALRYFNVPSPRRPEYRYMVEAAFRPFRSFHGAILGTIFLHQLGVIKGEQDMAYHISVEGDFDDVKYIAFSQQFVNRTRKKIKSLDAKFRRMAPLMSKGFINYNPDVEACYSYKPDCRTEIRVCACFTDGDDLRLSFVDDLISTHLLLCGAGYGLNEWKEYKEEIDDYVSKLPPIFRELLDSNWYEATGDSRDSGFVGRLPIVMKREEVNSLVKEQDIARELETNFHRIIGKYTEQIHDRFVSLFDLKLDFSPFALSKYGIPYYIPDGVKVEDEHVLKK